MIAQTPEPGSVVALLLEGTCKPLCLAADDTESARGCLVALSADAANLRISSAETVPVLAISTNCREPCSQNTTQHAFWH